MDISTESIHIRVQLAPTVDMTNTTAIEKALKLVSTISINNMHLFGINGKLTLYKSPEDIMDAFAPIRLEYYTKRKAHLLYQLCDVELTAITDEVMFMEAMLKGTMDIRGKDENTIRLELCRLFEFDTAVTTQDMLQSDKCRNVWNLLNKPIHSISKPALQKLHSKHQRILQEIEQIKATSITDMWLKDLDAVEDKYQEYLFACQQAKDAANDETYSDNNNIITPNANGHNKKPAATKRKATITEVKTTTTADKRKKMQK